MSFTRMALGLSPINRRSGGSSRRRAPHATGVNTSLVVEDDLPPMEEDTEGASPEPMQAIGDIPAFPEEVDDGYLDDVLVNMVRGEDNKVEVNRSATFDGLIHVSSLLDFCPRRLFLSNKYGQDQVHSVDGNMRIVWAMGRAVETHIRAQIIEADPDNCFGNWLCDCGRNKINSTFRPPADTKCVRCDTHIGIYDEHTLTHRGKRVVGNPDLFLRVAGKLVPIEIKSMNAAEFAKLSAPKGDHVFQVSAYHKTFKEEYGHLPVELADHCIILYANKDFKWGKNPYKQFTIEGDAIDNTLEESFTDAKTAAEAIEADIIPNRLPACTEVGCRKAKGCALKTLCFSL